MKFHYTEITFKASSEPTGFLSVTLLSTRGVMLPSSVTDRKPVGSDDAFKALNLHLINQIRLKVDHL